MFEVLARDGAARRGRLRLPHGIVETPAFMPVGTQGAVKGIGPEGLERLGAEIQLCNLYHLAVRPGIDSVVEAGGLHAFTGWRRPLLTDSGGFQVMSLARLRTLDEDGVTFRNHVDGGAIRFRPEEVVSWQERLGVDVAMVLDECPPWPAPREVVAGAVERTARWAVRALAARRGAAATALFGIVQGGVERDLRQRAVDSIASLEFDGFAIGGVSVGEPEALRRAVVEWTAPLLPADRPRYLMGVGTPLDLAHAVLEGIDLFDCVLPARNARHGLVYTRRGPLRIKNATFRADPRPLDEDCTCETCRTVGRALLHHLFKAGEITAAVLLTIHNLRYYLDFMSELRQAIEQGCAATVPIRLQRAAAVADSLDPSRADPS